MCGSVHASELVRDEQPGVAQLGRRVEDLVPADLKKFTLLHSATCHLNWRSWFRHAGIPHAIKDARAMSFDSCMLSSNEC